MANWEGRSRGNAGGYRIFIFLIRFFGILPAYFLLVFVVFYYFLFSIRTSRPIWDLYRNKMRFGTFWSLTLLFKNYMFLGQCLIDKSAIFSGRHSKYKFIFEGEQYLERMIREGQGGILLSAHLGNWDVAGHLLGNLHVKVNIVMYDGEDRQIKSVLEEFSGKELPKIIYIREDLSHVFEISQALAGNELVCMHADRFLEGKKTIRADFFGETASFPEGPFLLSLKMKKPVAFVYAVKRGLFTYHLYSSPLKNFSIAKGDQVQSILAEYVKRLEDMTRRFPCQWFNYYDFWKAA